MFSSKGGKKSQVDDTKIHPWQVVETLDFDLSSILQQKLP
jgi:hypothetical protein